MKTPLPSLGKGLKGFRYGEALRPARDWFVLLGIGCFLFLASLAWNLWQFSRVTSGEGIGNGEPPLSTGSGLTMEPVTELFRKRAEERSRYLGEYRFVDPSVSSR